MASSPIGAIRLQALPKIQCLKKFTARKNLGPRRLKSSAEIGVWIRPRSKTAQERVRSALRRTGQRFVGVARNGERRMVDPPPGDWIVSPGWFAAAAILLWATRLVPEYLTSLLLFSTAMIFHAAPPDIVFSGFQSDAFWLLLSGFVLGAAIGKVGIADRIGLSLSSLFGRSWFSMVSGVVAITYLLAFIMPSNTGRSTLLMPIVLALADRTGLGEGSRGRIGLALAVGLGTNDLSASILPASLPNLILSSTAAHGYGLTFAYSTYLLLHGPILGLFKGAIIAVYLTLAFPASPRMLPRAEAGTKFSADEWKLSAILLVTLVLWMTDSIHGIRAAWIGLISACICLLPRVGLLSSEDFVRDINIRTCIYLAGILALASIVTWSHLGEQIGNVIIPRLPLDAASPAKSFASILGLASLLNFVATANELPAVFTPLAKGLAQHSGIPLATVLMSQVLVYATPLLPYQAIPIVVATRIGRVPTRHAVLACAVIGAISYAFLAPLDYLWFGVLGWLP
jgi:di/tricarboxylate transporter